VLTIVIRLVIITALVYAGVQYWYGTVEKRLQKQIPSSARVVQQPPPAEASTEAVSDTSSDEVAAILARNIFQAKGAEETETSGNTVEADIDQLAQTQLSLSLLGTVTGIENDARAIIRDDKTKLEDLYRVGSEIQGALVKHITRGRVVLSVNGRDEVLVIKDREGKGGSMASSPRQRLPISIGDPDEAQIKPTPRAVPRRRISFRSAVPKPTIPAPEEMNEASEPEAPPAVEEPPPPEEETLQTEPEPLPDSAEPESESAVDVPQQ